MDRLTPSMNTVPRRSGEAASDPSPPSRPAETLPDLNASRPTGGLRVAPTVRLASEKEFKELFPDCETGAMPPFGNIYGMKVFVDVELSHQHEIAFNAGSHTEVIKMAYADFDRLVRPLSVAAVTA